LKCGSLNIPGTLRVCPGLYRDGFTFTLYIMKLLHVYFTPFFMYFVPLSASLHSKILSTYTK
jgi:hypothetical protein